MSNDEVVDRAAMGLADFPELHRLLPRQWLEKQLRASPLYASHPLVRWATLRPPEHRQQLLGGLERAISCLREARPARLERVLNRLRTDRDPGNFRSTMGEIRLAAHFVRQEFEIELDPAIPDSNARGDIRLGRPLTQSVYIELYSSYDTGPASELWEMLACALRGVVRDHHQQGNFHMDMVCPETARLNDNTMRFVVDQTTAWLLEAPDRLDEAVTVCELESGVMLVAKPDGLPGPHPVYLSGGGPALGLPGGVKGTIEQVAREKARRKQFPSGYLCIFAVEFALLPKIYHLCLLPDDPMSEDLKSTDWDLPPEIDFVLGFIFSLKDDNPWGMQQFKNPKSGLGS